MLKVYTAVIEVEIMRIRGDIGEVGRKEKIIDRVKGDSSDWGA